MCFWKHQRHQTRWACDSISVIAIWPLRRPKVPWMEHHLRGLPGTPVHGPIWPQGLPSTGMTLCCRFRPACLSSTQLTCSWMPKLDGYSANSSHGTLFTFSPFAAMTYRLRVLTPQSTRPFIRYCYQSPVPILAGRPGPSVCRRKQTSP